MSPSTRRAFAAIVLACLAWTALWPLVSSAHALVTSEAMPLCHQAGMQVGLDEPVMDPASPSPQPGKQHCPLCIMGFLAVATTVPVVPADRIAPCDLARAYRDRVYPANLSTRLAESRAPPSFVIPA
jgi:hypothetical protein